MECKGIVRRVDELGRIVLPREMRRTLNVREGTQLEISIVDGCKFLLSKYSPIGTLNLYSQSAVTAIAESIEHDIIITDLEQVVATNKKRYAGKTLSNNVQDLIYNKELIIKRQADGSSMLDIFADETNTSCCQLVVPIIKDGDAIGSIIILASENKCFDDSSVKVCRAFAKFLTEQIM